MNDTPRSTDSSTRYTWYVILLLASVNAFNWTDRMALAMLVPLIKGELHLSDSELGFLIGFAFAIFYAVCAIPIARWADQGVRRNVISLAVAMWSVMTALSGAAQNFWHLLLARIGVGVGEAGSFAPGASILCDYVAVKQRPLALSIHITGNNVGILAGMALAGLLGEMIGWRWTFVALGLPGIVLAVIVRMTLREPIRGRLDAETVTRVTPRRTARDFAGTLWRCRTYRTLVVFWMAAGFAIYSLTQWWPSFYARAFVLHQSKIGLYLGVALAIGGGVGAVVGGTLSNKLAGGDLKLPLKIAGVVTALATPTALGVLFTESVEVSMFFAFLTVLLGGISSGPILATQYSVMPSDLRATAGAFVVFVNSIVGGLGTFCVGVLSDSLVPSQGAYSLRYALLLPICLYPVMAIVLLKASRFVGHDLQNTEAGRGETPKLATSLGQATVGGSDA